MAKEVVLENSIDLDTNQLAIDLASLSETEGG
jgi:hypothetical protein